MSNSVYQRVTDQIVKAIESGASKYRMPWHVDGSAAASPINVVSKKPYRGINTAILWATSDEKGYSSAEWATYQQWQERGAQVRKGEKSTGIVFWQFKAKPESEDSETADSTLAFCRQYAVFNSAQVDGYEPQPIKQINPDERIAFAESFFAAIPAKVNHGGNRAFYRKTTDEITLPDYRQFFTAADYYTTRSHETAHWTGAESRCNRQFGKRFGDDAYAMEELVAELASAFTMAHIGLELTPREDHAAYIASWLKVFKSDPRAIFTAASKAQAAADFIISHSQETSIAA